MKSMLKLMLICLFSSLGQFKYWNNWNLKFISLSSVISSTFDCKGKKENGFYKDPENAHEYFECVGGKAINFTCPENLVLDETKQACDYAKDPNATTSALTSDPLTTHTAAPPTIATSQKPTTAAPTTIASTAQPTTKATTAAPTSKATTAAPTSKATTAAPTSKATTAAPTSKATTAAPTSKPTTASPTHNSATTARLTTNPSSVTSTQTATTDAISAKECAGKPDGFHRDPKDDHKYFECVGGRGFHFVCPENLVFNEISKACDYSITPDPNATTAQTTAKPTTK